MWVARGRREVLSSSHPRGSRRTRRRGSLTGSAPGHGSLSPPDQSQDLGLVGPLSTRPPRGRFFGGRDTTPECPFVRNGKDVEGVKREPKSEIKLGQSSLGGVPDPIHP